MPEAPWSKYRDTTAWKTFDRVSHVTHIAHAVSVVAAKEIAPRLIRDESILRSQRIEVVWLSPNDWFHGYRYGNVAFNYRWGELVADKRCYWVEATKHSPVACRFLITDVKHPLLKRYAPETDTGPWRYRPKTNRHQFNGNLTMEFMFEGEIPLRDCIDTTFVDHHPGMCSNSIYTCPELGMSKQKAGGLFLAAVLGRNMDAEFLNMNQRRGVREASIDLEYAAHELMAILRTIPLTTTGSIKAGQPVAKALVRAILQSFPNDCEKERARLAALFASNKEVQRAVEKLLRLAFDLPKVTDVAL